MIHLLLLIVSLMPSTLTYANFSSTAAKDLKQPVNFSGKITTHQGQEFVVDNISIQGKYEKIAIPLKPENLPEPVLNSETNQREVKLDANPNIDYLKRDLDLAETKEIQVPSPNTIYFYQQKKNSKRLEFVEMEVTSNSGNKYYLLLEAKTPIYCDGIDSAGPQETTVPLSALKTLTIDGYTYRDTSKDANKKCNPSGCPPCEQKNK